MVKLFNFLLDIKFFCSSTFNLFMDIISDIDNTFNSDIQNDNVCLKQPQQNINTVVTNNKNDIEKKEKYVVNYDEYDMI